MPRIPAPNFHDSDWTQRRNHALFIIPLKQEHLIQPIHAVVNLEKQ